MTCPSCGLALPAHARFCARCGTRLQSDASPGLSPPAASAPVWLQVLLWLGAGGLFWIAVGYLALAAGWIPPASIGPGVDVAALRGTAFLIAACAASLAVAHAVAAIGLAANRPWARTFTTLVCGVWMLSCVGLPVGLLGISALWRSRAAAAGVGPAASRPVN